VVPADWRDAVVDEAGRVERIPYELCVLRSLREGLRRREIWVVGANRWRNPEADLPTDFEANREVHYAALRQPLDPSAFIDELRRRIRSALGDLEVAVENDDTGGVRFSERRGEAWISVPRPQRLPEPANLEDLKRAVESSFGTIDLLDVLKEADYLTDLTAPFTSVASREVTPRSTVRRRLLLALFGLGTNIGIKQIAAGEHGETDAALRRTRWLYVNRTSLRQAILRVVNATFAVRDPRLWGVGTACASDSKKFGSWESNVMTEWHARYRGPGVMIYWHVEKNAVCIYSQLKSCSSSEVAAMIEGLLRHCTEAEIDRNYVDTHGQSAVGFAFTYLLGLSLLPRLKNIGSARLYRPDGEDGAWPHLAPVLTRAIRWDLIAQQYDQMVKYATALRLGTAEAEAILRRFTRPGPPAPHLPGPRRAGPGGQDGLPGGLPQASSTAKGDPRGAAGRRELEQCQRGPVLRQGERADRCRPGGPGGDRAGPASFAVGPCVHQHHLPPGGAGGVGLGRPADRGGPARAHSIVLDAREPLRFSSRFGGVVGSLVRQGLGGSGLWRARGSLGEDPDVAEQAVSLRRDLLQIDRQLVDDVRVALDQGLLIGIARLEPGGVRFEFVESSPQLLDGWRISANGSGPCLEPLGEVAVLVGQEPPLDAGLCCELHDRQLSGGAQRCPGHQAISRRFDRRPLGVVVVH
jgi:hypothetical protein